MKGEEDDLHQGVSSVGQVIQDQTCGVASSRLYNLSHTIPRVCGGAVTAGCWVAVLEVEGVGWRGEGGVYLVVGWRALVVGVEVKDACGRMEVEGSGWQGGCGRC